MSHITITHELGAFDKRMWVVRVDGALVYWAESRAAAQRAMDTHIMLRDQQQRLNARQS